MIIALQKEQEAFDNELSTIFEDIQAFKKEGELEKLEPTTEMAMKIQERMENAKIKVGFCV